MRSGDGVRLFLRAETAVALPERLTVKLAHPTRAGQDQLMEMQAQGQGFYAGHLQGEISGRWLVSIEDPAGKWRLHGDWKTDSLEPLRLVAGQGGK